VNTGKLAGQMAREKSTLLSLITGDHPQGYSNDLTLFGRRRGSGETIWDIKKHIGYVSSSLHLDYRVSTTVRNVILSGYFDSIAFIRPFRIASKNWCSSGWIFSALINARLTLLSIVFPGDSSVWR